MTRAERVEVSAVKAMNAGYEFIDKGMGIYDTVIEYHRAEGYDVKAWYTQMKGDKETWQWIMYGKKKGQRRVSTKKVIDFSAMTSKELKKLCSEKKISGYSKMNKSQMIESLQSAC